MQIKIEMLVNDKGETNIGLMLPSSQKDFVSACKLGNASQENVDMMRRFIRMLNLSVFRLDERVSDIANEMLSILNLYDKENKSAESNHEKESQCAMCGKQTSSVATILSPDYAEKPFSLCEECAIVLGFSPENPCGPGGPFEHEPDNDDKEIREGGNVCPEGEKGLHEKNRGRNNVHGDN